jgi:hypothetical protein
VIACLWEASESLSDTQRSVMEWIALLDLTQGICLTDPIVSKMYFCRGQEMKVVYFYLIYNIILLNLFIFFNQSIISCIHHSDMRVAIASLEALESIIVDSPVLTRVIFFTQIFHLRDNKS